jgi:chorismate mutase
MAAGSSGSCSRLNLSMVRPSRRRFPLISAARFRRYTSPDEHPFTDIRLLPEPILPAQDYPPLLHPPSANHPSTNANARILKFYVDSIVPTVTANATNAGAHLLDDGNYGSAATRDVEVLQALSRRIHFGKSTNSSPAHCPLTSIGMFVSESKFQSAPQLFVPHILANPPNTEALTSLIYKPEVEARLLVRLANKARIYGGEFDSEGRIVENEGARKLDIEGVVGMYRDYVIPLTKDVEVSSWRPTHLISQVDYLIHRLEGVSQSQINAWLELAQ